MNMEINFTYLDIGWSLCLVCNLGSINGRFRRVFGSVLFTVLFLHIKQRKVGDSRQASPTNCSRITKQCRESPQKHHIKPDNFHISVSLHGDHMAILVRENLKNIQLLAIFPSPQLFTWKRHYRLHKFRLHSVLSLLNSNPDLPRPLVPPGDSQFSRRSPGELLSSGGKLT